ncbi:MAG TPA: cell division protein FtsZ [Desulfobacteraceae bacterium]|nr:cell division protein FtsZ [Desulfobacteraceae bacterium]
MKFELVQERNTYKARIGVIGIGGAGGNAINNLINSQIPDVTLVSANTDNQALEACLCPFKIQLGPNITRGMGTGADPEKGRKAAEESASDIRDALSGFDMVFLAAGMGKGTGTGASPVIARICKEEGALTVAVVIKPFEFEGPTKMKRADEGINELKKEVDTLIVIPNERLLTLSDGRLSLTEAMKAADNILVNAIRGISDLITHNGFINLDFADVRKIMEQKGNTVIGCERAKGENRCREAAMKAIENPLLEGISIKGARGALINFRGPSDINMKEFHEAAAFIRDQVHPEAEIHYGVVIDENMRDEVQVTVIATGINSDTASKIVRLRDVTSEEADEPWTVKLNGKALDAALFNSLDRDDMEGGQIAHKDEKPKTNFLKRVFKRGSGEDLDVPTYIRLRKADKLSV